MRVLFATFGAAAAFQTNREALNRHVLSLVQDLDVNENVNDGCQQAVHYGVRSIFFFKNFSKKYVFEFKVQNHSRIVKFKIVETKTG